jgi:TRAP-type C4-dicarboxylate transport system substrate-binding protein
MNSQRRHSRLFAFTIVAAMSITACGDNGGDGGGSSGDKVGSATDVTRLTMIASSRQGRPTAQGAALFAEAVNQLSSGTVAVNVTYIDSANLNRPDFEWGSIDEMLNGNFDLSLVPARAWSNLGVTTLDPLQLPGITSDIQTDRIAKDPVVDDLLAGLHNAGATGLGLLPEGLRHMAITDGRPINTVDDLAGLVVHAERSKGTWALIEALGSTPEPTNPEWNDKAEAGTLQAAETSFSLLHTLPAAVARSSMVANLTLYAEFGVLAIGNDSVAKLPPDVLDVLRRAAGLTLESKIESRPRETDMIALRCSEGYPILTLPDAEVVAAMNKLSSVVETTRSDPATKALADRVQAAAGTPDSMPSFACDETPRTVPPANKTSDVFPQGLMRATGFTAAELQAKGFSREDAVEWSADYWEDEYADGVVTERQLLDDKVIATCQYDVVVDGDQFTWSGHEGDCGFDGPLYTAQWTFDGDTFHFEILAAHQPVAERWDELASDFVKVD